MLSVVLPAAAAQAPALPRLCQRLGNHQDSARRSPASAMLSLLFCVSGDTSPAICRVSMRSAATGWSAGTM